MASRPESGENCSNVFFVSESPGLWSGLLYCTLTRNGFDATVAVKSGCKKRCAALTGSSSLLLRATASTNALPTTMASACPTRRRTCSGRPTPKPTASGRRVWERSSFSRRSTASMSGSSDAPVTPRRETTYAKPSLASAIATARCSGVPGAINSVSAIPNRRNTRAISADSSSGRSAMMTPLTFERRASRAKRSIPYIAIGFK
jgi:hypothetical protein